MRPVIVEVTSEDTIEGYNPIWWRRVLGDGIMPEFRTYKAQPMIDLLDAILRDAVNLNIHEDHETHDT